MTALSDKGKPTIIKEERHTFRAGRFGTIPSAYINECICGSLKNDPIHKVSKSLVQPDMPEKPVTSISEHTRPKGIFPKSSDFSWGESGLPDKKIVKQATDYSNLSQWIQMEIWKYRDTLVVQRDATELADKIIKRVLEDKNLVNNKIHKEGFDAGVLKERKRIIKKAKEFVVTGKFLIDFVNELQNAIKKH